MATTEQAETLATGGRGWSTCLCTNTTRFSRRVSHGAFNSSKRTGTTTTQLSTVTHEWHRIRMDYANAARGCAGWCFSAG
eukprot:3983918-Pyramimonas_sp.AAC.1